jgi:hypothetical protein
MQAVRKNRYVVLPKDFDEVNLYPGFFPVLWYIFAASMTCGRVRYLVCRSLTGLQEASEEKRQGILLLFYVSVSAGSMCIFRVHCEHVRVHAGRLKAQIIACQVNLRF